MTISSTTRRAGPYTGNGSATAFAFLFKVFAKTDILVTLTTPAGEDQSPGPVLDSDYSVTLNADQDNNPGGTITYPISGAPLPTGWKLTISGSLANTQPTDIQNTGGFYPQVIEDALDRAVIQVQQLAEQVGRSIRFSIVDPSGSANLPPVEGRANKALVFDENGQPTASEDDYNDQAAAAAASAAAAAGFRDEANAAVNAAQGYAGEAADAASDAAAAEDGAIAAKNAAEAALTNMASYVTVVPAGTIQSTNVQAALQELDGDIQSANTQISARLRWFATVPGTNQGSIIAVQDVGLMRWNGTAYESMLQRRLFQSGTSGSWVAPITGTVVCELQGGGGGGGAGGGGYNGTGGGAGGYLRFLMSVVKGVSYPYAVGAGGNPGATSSSNGSTGGDTTMFGGSARGGEGGNGGALSAAGGLGGQATLPGGANGFALTGAAGMPGFSSGPTVNGGEGLIGGRGGRGGQASGADTKTAGTAGRVILGWNE
ncbi:glycine-rich domain-containing protein [Bordetella genomosp. 1]|uniref:Glycine-rich domain-containing protein n=1 Tax=Bordetella genomosp. 1 TaxID=1395607 RepID=A0ABX4EW48_9BORD|nr:hypothetical protein [Bordetella genomosp. 1]OZI58704.1 hypothetical protein CAL27_18655 [Bordetella genomosp. 1]